MQYGENVHIESKGTKLVITLDTTHRGGLSDSKKTRRVASTCGNIKLPSGITVGLNAYVSANEAAPASIDD